MNTQTEQPRRRTEEVPVVEPDGIEKMRVPANLRWGKRQIEAELGVSVNAVRQHLHGTSAGVRVRPQQAALGADKRALAVAL